MTNKEMVKQLVKLQVLTVRWVERNTSLRCPTHRDCERVLTSNKLTCTYGEAIKNLINNIKKYCKSSYLIEEALKLEEAINSSEIKNLRFGIEPQRKFTDEEQELDTYKIKVFLYMINGMVDIKYMAKNYDLTESAIKQACQQERLLNTRKVGKTWMVHIYECKAYWNIKDELEEKHLYKDWVY